MFKTQQWQTAMVGFNNKIKYISDKKFEKNGLYFLNVHKNVLYVRDDTRSV